MAHLGTKFGENISKIGRVINDFLWKMTPISQQNCYSDMDLDLLRITLHLFCLGSHNNISKNFSSLKWTRNTIFLQSKNACKNLLQDGVRQTMMESPYQSVKVGICTWVLLWYVVAPTGQVNSWKLASGYLKHWT